MSPGDPSTCADETRALLVGPKSANEHNILLGCTLVITGLVSGTYYWFAALPAFERDKKLDWTPHVTMVVATTVFVAENVGYLLLGPIADRKPPAMLLALNAVFMVIAIVFQLLCWHAWQLASIIIVMCAMKGIMWPAICSLFGANIAPSRQDVALLVGALGSRLAETATKMWVGKSMSPPLALGWHRSIAMLLVLIVILFMWALSVFPSLLVEASKHDSDGPPHIEGVDKWWRLISSPAAWLEWLILLNAGTIWSLNSYVGLLLVDVYGISVGTASFGSSAIPSGMAAGLLIGAVASGRLDATVSHTVHVLQIAIGAAALGVLAFCPNLQLGTVFCLLFLAGFGAVIPSYLPSLKYAASSPPAERGFRLGVIWATTSTVGTFVTLYFGSLRVQNMEAIAAASRMYGLTGVGVLIAGLLLVAKSFVLPSPKEMNCTKGSCV